MATEMFQDIPRDAAAASFLPFSSGDSESGRAAPSTPAAALPLSPSLSSELPLPLPLLAASPFERTGVLVRLPPVKQMKEIALIWSVPPTRYNIIIAPASCDLLVSSCRCGVLCR